LFECIPDISIIQSVLKYTYISLEAQDTTKKIETKQIDNTKKILRINILAKKE